MKCGFVLLFALAALLSVQKADAFIKVPKFITDIGDDAVDAFENLSEDIQEIVADAEKFAKSSIDELEQIGDDLLVKLDELKDLPVKTIKQMLHRIEKFAIDQLESFLSKLTQSQLVEVIKAFGCEDKWDPDQAKVIVKKGLDVFGAITGWTPERFIEIGNLVKGLAKGDIENLGPLVFKTAVIVIAFKTGQNPDVVEAFAQKAVDVIGEVATWREDEWRSVGDVAKGLANGDIEAIDDSENLNNLLRANGLDTGKIATAAGVAKRLVTKSDGSGGFDLSNLNAGDFQIIAGFATGLDPEDFNTINDIGVEALGRITSLSPDQYGNLVTRAETLFGDIKEWDEDKWKSVGNAVLGFTQEQIAKIDKDGIAAFGKLTNLDLEKAESLVTRAKDVLGEVSDWDETKWGQIGTAIIALKDTDIQSINLDGIKKFAEVALEKSLTPEQISALANRMKALKGEAADWSADDWKALGSAVQGLTPADLRAASEGLFEAAQSVDIPLSSDQLKSVLGKAEELYGEVSQWDEARWLELGTLAYGLAKEHAPLASLEELKKLAKLPDNWCQDEVVALFGRAKALVGDVKNIASQDFQELGALASGMSVDEIAELTGDQLKGLGQAKNSACEAVKATQDTLRCVGNKAEWAKDKLEKLGDRAMATIGDVSGWNVADSKALGWIKSGLPGAELGDVAADVLDTYREIACFDTSQLECIMKGAQKAFAAGKGIKEWGQEEFSKAKDFAAGIHPDNLKELTKEQLMGSVAELGNVTRWNLFQTNLLANLAKEAYGTDVSEWDDDLIGNLNNLISGLHDADIPKLSTGGIQKLSVSAIVSLSKSRQVHLMTTAQLSSMSEEQSKAILPEEVELMTTEQLASVSEARGESSGSSSRAWIAAAVLIPMFVLVVIGYLVYAKRNEHFPFSGQRRGRGVLPQHKVKTGANKSVNKIRKQFNEPVAAPAPKKVNKKPPRSPRVAAAPGAPGARKAPPPKPFGAPKPRAPPKPVNAANPANRDTTAFRPPPPVPASRPKNYTGNASVSARARMFEIDNPLRSADA